MVMRRSLGLLNVRPALGAKRPAARHRADTQRDLSPYRLPSQSILHREDIADSALNVGALTFFAIFITAICVFLSASFAVLRAVGV
jgi:hypothetical protein